jgi:hypothetical protein
MSGRVRAPPCHSQYSFLTGAVKLGSLADSAVKQHGMLAVALTDTANHVRRPAPLQRLSRRRACSPSSAASSTSRARRRPLALCVLLRPNRGRLPEPGRVWFRRGTSRCERGRRRASRSMRSRAEQGPRRAERLSRRLVPQGVILESGRPARAPAARRAPRRVSSRATCSSSSRTHGFPEQRCSTGSLTEAARDLELPLIATNDVHFLDKETTAVAQVLPRVHPPGRTYESGADPPRQRRDVPEDPTAWRALPRARPKRSRTR